MYMCNNANLLEVLLGKGHWDLEDLGGTVTGYPQ